jgi:hypothetical protein
MTEEKEIKFAILKGTNFDLAKAKECYTFLSNEEQLDRTAKANGLYIIYADGHAEPYTGANRKDNVRYIGVAFEGKSFAVSLKESEEVILLSEDNPAGERKRLNRECDAIHDFDSFKNTAALCEDNQKLREVLEEGEAIPALGVLNIIAHLREALNEALDYVGGATLSDTWYWSSTEYYPSGAWNVNFSGGTANTNGKYNGGAVRAVAAF